MDIYSGTIAGTFGVSAGVFALFFLGEVPRVRRDILQKFPFFDQYFDRRVAPEDNVSDVTCLYLSELTADWVF